MSMVLRRIGWVCKLFNFRRIGMEAGPWISFLKKYSDRQNEISFSEYIHGIQSEEPPLSVCRTLYIDSQPSHHTGKRAPKRKLNSLYILA
jgi:hypothetical protein